MKRCNIDCSYCDSTRHPNKLIHKNIEDEIVTAFGDYNIDDPFIREIVELLHSTTNCDDCEKLRQILLGIRKKDANNPCPWKQDLDYAYRFGSPCLKNLVERLIAQKMYRKNYDKRRYHRKS